MDEGQARIEGLAIARVKPGRLDWVGLRPSRGAPMRIVQQAELLTDQGLRGDHTSLRGSKKRQVSLIQAEHLPVIAALVGRSEVAPELLRRNLVVSGINLLALRARRFRIGDAVLQGEGTCDPCSKMEVALGTGGFNAMRGHGGILARVIQGAIIRVGDAVDFCADEAG